MLVLFFSSKLNWRSYIFSTAKSASKTIGTLIHSMNFLSPKTVLYLYNSIIWPGMKYCCHVWAYASNYYLDMLDKLQNVYVRLLIFHMLSPLNPWLIAEMLPA